MQKNTLKIMAFAAFVLVAATACERENLEAPMDTVEDVAEMELLVDDAEAEAEYQLDFSLNADPDSANATPCVTLTWAQPRGTFPNTLTIDFGQQGCVGRHGRIRKGQIIVNISSPMWQTGSTRNVSFNNFSVNDIAVTGTIQLVNNGNQTFTRTVSNAQLTRTDGTVVRSWNAVSTWTYSNNGTPNYYWDDSISITGSSNGVNRNGDNFTSTILTPLVRTRTCRWTTSGIVEHTINGDTYTLDFGNGQCDRQAVITDPNGGTRTISLRH